jgi:hypothetical protein
MDDDVQFHPILQLFRSGILEMLQGFQGPQPLVAGAILNPPTLCPVLLKQTREPPLPVKPGATKRSPG